MLMVCRHLKFLRFSPFHFLQAGRNVVDTDECLTTLILPIMSFFLASFLNRLSLLPQRYRCFLVEQSSFRRTPV
jgi:hypothetical protein